MPATVNTPPTIAQSPVRKWRKEEDVSWNVALMGERS
eukprot:CAMPEP_0202812984 /NCGR_PEP_ID=MMETSP1389-20130828/4517_1 /ASSEMBLY_ACC=CAM_ASM_000865 /TAXON_ID=302021 /ORGANISM="Rhodomonas sp., Strain CCMP768" /LENGTH=36 /DNA_ID= /DNA_START= /DNA_END= /DNA_ORIENTATION=